MGRSLYRYIWSRSARAQGLAISLSIIVFPLSMVPLELQRRIINEAIGTRQIGLLVLLGGTYLAIILLQGALKYWMNMCRSRIGEHLTADLRRTISRHHRGTAEGGADAADDMSKAGTTVAMVAAEVEPLGKFAGESFSVPVVQSGVLLSVVAYMIVVEPWLALASLGILAPQIVVILLVQRAVNRRNKRRIELIRDVGDKMTEDHYGRAEPDVQSSEREDIIRHIGNIQDLRITVHRLKYSLKTFRNILNHLSEIFVLVIGGWMVIKGATELGTIVAFLSGLQRVRDPWRDLVAYFRQASDARIKYGLIRSELKQDAPAAA